MSDESTETQKRVVRRRWDQQELIAIRDKLADVYRTMPHANYKALLDNTQVILPEERRARTMFPSFVPRTFRSMVDTLRAERRAKHIKAQKAEQEAPKEEDKELAPVEHPTAMDSEPERDWVGQENSQTDLSPVATVQILAELLTRIGYDLANRLDRIEEAVLKRIETLSLTPAPSRPAWTPPPPTELHVPKEERVAIIGLMKDQFEHVKQRSNGLPFRLIFVDKEDSHARIPPTDYIIVQRHTRHMWWEKARATVPSPRLAFVGGGISEVVQRLHDFHSRRMAEVARG